MPKIIKRFLGKLIEVNKKNNIPYDEWLNDYMQQAGMILIYESVNKDPGKQFIYFYLNDPDSINQKILSYIGRGFGY